MLQWDKNKVDGGGRKMGVVIKWGTLGVLAVMEPFCLDCGDRYINLHM